MELIVAIGLFAIFATFAIAAINPFEQFKKSQDATRKSDLAQIQRALEIYYNDFGQYPSHTTTQPAYLINPQSGAVSWGSQWQPYIDILPSDPDGSKTYVYYATNDNQTYYVFSSLARADKDPDSCNSGLPCQKLSTLGIADVACGGECNYGVSSPNTSP